MFIIPFVHTVINQPNINQTTININTIKILTIGGRNIWQEENILDIDKDILNPNDLYRATKKTIKLSNNIFLYEIDANKTNVLDQRIRLLRDVWALRLRVNIVPEI